MTETLWDIYGTMTTISSLAPPTGTEGKALSVFLSADLLIVKFGTTSLYPTRTIFRYPEPSLESGSGGQSAHLQLLQLPAGLLQAVLLKSHSPSVSSSPDHPPPSPVHLSRTGLSYVLQSGSLVLRISHDLFEKRPLTAVRTTQNSRQKPNRNRPALRYRSGSMSGPNEQREPGEFGGLRLRRMKSETVLQCACMRVHAHELWFDLSAGGASPTEKDPNQNPL